MEIAKTILTYVQMIVALGLIGIIMSQATKSEGLTGTIGGKAESAFRGKPGTEERLQTATKVMAISFMVASAAVGVFMK